MTDLLQIFSGNPMTTFVGKKVEAATKPELESEDWALNIEICDIINENDDDAKDAARAIKKRLQQIEQDHNFIITNRTLTLLDTCVSNCSHRFHLLVMTKDFIQDLVKLIGPKNNPPIELQERVLSLIERWADAFRNQPDLSGVVSVYNDLKSKGVTFPPRDPSSHVPIQTPQRSVPAPARHETRPMQPMMPPPTGGSSSAAMPPAAGGGGGVLQQQPPGQVVLEGEGYNKISQDLIVVQSSIEMFTDILKALESPASEHADWTLAEELSVTCSQMKDRIVDLIERVANEDLTIELLRLNDELNNMFNKYERLVKNRAKSAVATGVQQSRAQDISTTQPTQPDSHSTTRPAAAPKLPGVSSRTLNDLSLIDFNAASSGDSNVAQQQQKLTATNTQAASTILQSLTTTTTTTTTPVDPFDTSNILTDKAPQPLADSLSRLDLGTTGAAGGSAGAAKISSAESNSKSKQTGTNLPVEISSVREQDFAEIENWLSTDSGRDLASISGDMPSMEPISIPNAEFENFIASRALAGSNTPTSQQQQTDRNQQNQQKQKKPEPSV